MSNPILETIDPIRSPSPTLESGDFHLPDERNNHQNPKLEVIIVNRDVDGPITISPSPSVEDQTDEINISKAKTALSNLARSIDDVKF